MLSCFVRLTWQEITKTFYGVAIVNYFKNLTPHAITLRLPNGEDMIIPTSGTVARVSAAPRESADVSGSPVPVFPSPVFGEVENLPAPLAGYFYIVSGLALAHVKGRSDVFAPATGPTDGAIRNEKGHIVAVTCLVASPNS